MIASTVPIKDDGEGPVSWGPRTFGVAIAAWAECWNPPEMSEPPPVWPFVAAPLENGGPAMRPRRRTRPVQVCARTRSPPVARQIVSGGRGRLLTD